jgi:hypothetical protein
MIDMKITIEVADTTELEQIMLLCQSLRISDIHVSIPQNKPKPIIEKGDKSIDPSALFGIWKDNPRTLDGIRSKAWREVPKIANRKVVTEKNLVADNNSAIQNKKKKQQ